MTGIEPTGPNEKEVNCEVRRKYEDDEDTESSFYVEKDSGMIYEVRFFPEFVLIRPAHPDYSAALEKIDILSFANTFEEYCGDPEPIKNFMWGHKIDSFEIIKKK